MCGICGILSKSSSFDTDCLKRMLDSLKHRGPDDWGIYVSRQSKVQSPKPSKIKIQKRNRNGSIGLGNRRLSIIDLSESGRQPLCNEDETVWITYNGEIYNYRELRRGLETEGHKFKSNTDTEVLVHGFEEWGIDNLLDKLRGMYAFSIYDSRAETHDSRLFLVRDRMGIKPLYYFVAPQKDLFLFASEIRALLASDLISKEIDPKALEGYLGYQCVPSPRSLIKGIKSLPPGHYMRIQPGEPPETCQYWGMLNHLQNFDQKKSQVPSQKVLTLLKDAVKKRQIGDVPLGVFLSGGIDSSTVVALLSEVSKDPVKTFTVGFKDRQYDESRFAQQVAKKFGTHHHDIELFEHELLKWIPSAMKAQDQPSGDGVNTYLVSRAAKEAGIKVALSGLGGDELFAGYPSFKRLTQLKMLLAIWKYVPKPVRKSTGKIASKLSHSLTVQKLAEYLESDGSLAKSILINRELFPKNHRRWLLRDSYLENQDPYADPLKKVFKTHPKIPWLAKISYAEASTYMQDVLLRDTDQMSMASSLEVRVPLLDHKLVEYVLSVPDAYKRSNKVPKRLLIESLDGRLPKDIIYRPKRGFTLPFDQWMRGPLKQYCEEALNSDQTGLLKVETQRQLWQDFLAGKSNVTWSRVWSLVTLQRWCERHEVRSK